LRNTAIPEEIIIHTELPFLDLVPAGFDLFHAAQSLSGDISGQTLLKQAIQRHFSPDYDYIIIDAPPAFGFLSMLAMTAGDWLLVPVGPERTSNADCRCLLKLVHYIRKTHHARLRIAGFVFNECGSSLDFPAIMEQKKLSHLSDLVFDTIIPLDGTVVRAMNRQMPVVLEDINSPAGQAFLQFAREIDSMFT
jgi:chromosome partitioning protein